MKKLIYTIGILFFAQLLPAQLNMSLAGKLDYNIQLNDIWAWVAPDGTEYALVGTTRGLSIVSLADAENPEEVAFVSGPTSTWRDIKTWENYAYVSNETSGGIHIIDLSGLPEAVNDKFWRVDVQGDTLESIHNLFIDSIGFCYVAGSNLNRGGALIMDVNTDPWNPALVGIGADTYSHDIYVRGDQLFSSEINAGRMAIYDISDKSAPLLTGTQETPYQFTHNIWLSDDGRVAFTTDERFTAPVASYDVSDPTNIVELDQFRPAATLNEGNIPHNVHVWQDWLILSYYYDGGIIVDASRPSNLIEVGNFDTFFNLDPGTGAWGAYPYLPSGLVLVTDIGNGLFVLDANYVRAAWLEGKVTDGVTGDPILDVEVKILSEQPNVEISDLTGNYKTGQAIPGTFEVRFFKQGYLPAVKQAVLENGELTVLDAQLFPASLNSLSGITLMDEGGAVIPGATVLLQGEQGTYRDFSNEEGLFQLENIYEGDYQVYVGSWGYLPKPLGELSITKDTAITVSLERGYQDDFFFDFGWQSILEGEGARGAWQKGEPRGTYRADGEPVNPELDIEGDLGDQCFVTGNAGGSSGTDDVDDGYAILISPVMDLSSYDDPVLTYYAWFYNSGGSGAPDDSLVIRITNGTDTVVLENIGSDMSMGAWRPETFFRLRDYIELTDSMKLILFTGDIDPTGHLVEAALDFVRVREMEVINGTAEEDILEFSVKAFPNPFQDRIQLDLKEVQHFSGLQLRVFNQLGQPILQTPIPPGTPLFSWSAGDWAPGVYYFQLFTAQGRLKSIKVIKGR